MPAYGICVSCVISSDIARVWSGVVILAADGNGIESAKKARVAKALSSVSSSSSASTSIRHLPQAQSVPSSDPLDSKRSTLSADVIQFERIRGRNDHLNHLIEMIESAEESIDIFSYTLNFLPQEIFVALRDAAEREVGINLNVNEVRSQYTHDTLVDLGICISPDRQTHTKFAIVDDATAIVGSFNFLDKEHFFNEEDDNGESSFKIMTKSDLANRLRRRIHVDKTSYGCGRAQIPSPLEVPLYNDSKVYLLTNLSHHEEFFKFMMRNANENVIFYSPFVVFPNAAKRLQTINENLKSSVSLEIRVNADQINKIHGAFKKFPQLKRRTTITTGDFHRKSLIVDPRSDNPTICEGSFNWLCASTAGSSGGHNQETSVILMGPLAIPHLQADELSRR